MKIDWKKIGIKELASIVSDKLNENGIDAILVGGACVSIYSENKYLSSDLDFVSSTSIKEISPVLLKLGFKRKSSRHFEKNDCPLFIDFLFHLLLHWGGNRLLNCGDCRKKTPT